jgi:hypothetical protein
MADENQNRAHPLAAARSRARRAIPLRPSRAERGLFRVEAADVVLTEDDPARAGAKLADEALVDWVAARQGGAPARASRGFSGAAGVARQLA